MAEPGDHRAAPAGGGQGRLRASHADREQVIEVLKDAFAQGRLTQDELDTRAGQAFTSRTYAELAALTADLPAAPTAARPLRKPARARAKPQVNTGVRTGVRVIIVAATILAVLLLVRPDNGLAFVTGLGAAATVVMASALTVALMVESRRHKRSGGQLPPRPEQGGQAPEVQRPGQAGHDPALPRDRPDQARADLRSDSSRTGRPHLSGRGARAPRGIRLVPAAV
jgi:Domain of unknown function (DUF1707)